MSLIDQIKTDQLKSRKDRDSVKSSLLTTLLGEAVMVGKNAGNRESTDAEVIAIIKKFIKNNDETINLVSEDDSQYLVQENNILTQYLPTQMSEDALKVAISLVVAAESLTSPKDMGTVMNFLKDKFSGEYDGKLASTIARKLLS